MATARPMPQEPSLIVYDGECIFCQNYVKFMRLRETVGPVELLDARSDDPRVRQFWQQGLDLNSGMLFVYQGRTYHGHEAISTIASLSSDSTFFNRFNRLALSNRRGAALIYPLLKAGRRATLLLRGRKLLKAGGED
jgi:predicted DCC family thiol-disulfide oxidoreductase YuxK